MRTHFLPFSIKKVVTLVFSWHMSRKYNAPGDDGIVDGEYGLSVHSNPRHLVRTQVGHVAREDRLPENEISIGDGLLPCQSLKLLAFPRPQFGL